MRINHLAVWLAAIAYFLFGYLWFGLIFSKMWMALVGKAPADVHGAAILYAESFVLGLILSYATGIALQHPEDQTVRHGIGFAIFMGIAVYGTQTLNQALYEGRPLVLWLIDAGYVIVGFVIIGAIVGGWKKRVAS